tara:strand:- start:443 stop:667 length:225 start_codon:yes stop_codon:yes gene_type:complete
MAQVKSKEDYLIEHSKRLEELRNKADSIELEDGKFLDSPEEYAEDLIEKTIIQFLPDFIKAREEGKKLARRLID